ncbi:MAG: hypothetical protein RLZZ588_588 [Chloroflexota bacterium]
MSRDAGPRARVTRQRRGGVSITSTELAALVVRALRTSGAPATGEAALTLVDDATIATLNATHMGKRGPTDVLSFPLLDPHEFPARPGVRRVRASRRRAPRVSSGAGATPLGDIVISVDRAAEQAREGRGGTDGRTQHSVADEVRLLAVHGALHLCGWDHATATSQAAMWREQQRILRAHTAAMKRARAERQR